MPKRRVLNAFGEVTKQVGGRYERHLRTISPKADNGILPNIQKKTDSQSDLGVVIDGVEIAAGWTSENNASRTAA